MSHSSPVCCNPKAYRLMKRVASRCESDTALVEGALAIAMHELPETDPAKITSGLQELGQQVVRRVKGRQIQARIAHLHELLFVELGFIGNSLNYHDPVNSYLPAILETRRGLPITLSLLYRTVGSHAGLDIHGIGLPGHFCAGVVTPEGLMLVDPFYSGRVLNRDEAMQRISDTYGPEIEWSEDLLNPVTHRHWLTRMMQNLIHTFTERDRMEDVAAMLELELLLWPDQAQLKRDLGLVLARAGHSAEAGRFLADYLHANPQDPQREELEHLLDVLAQ